MGILFFRPSAGNGARTSGPKMPLPGGQGVSTTFREHDRGTRARVSFSAHEKRMTMVILFLSLCGKRGSVILFMSE